MATNYRRLNLPKTPLKDNFTLSHTGEDMYYVLENVDEVIHDDLMYIFQTLKLKPNMVMICASNNTYRSVDNIWVHSDLYIKNQRYVKPICGINYELGNTISHIHWFDTSESIEFFPIAIDYTVNGIGYIKKPNETFPIGAEIIETVELTKDEHPILFKTEVAHGVAYKTDVSPRLMATIRFDIDDIPSWDKAIEIFTPYFI